MVENAILTPFEFSDAVPAGKRRFWKQILPVTSIRYEGRKINFDKRFHVDLANSFAKSAFDQVPIVFADGNNGHNMDPRNFGGDVLDMEARDDGTWALIEADEEAAKAIEKNPKLGVSARIRQGVEKADGRKFSRAVEHVLLTMNPRVTGMSPWQAVDLSDEDAEIAVVDLTALTYKEGKSMGKTTKTLKRTKDGKIDLSTLSDDEFNSLLDLAQTMTEEDPDLDDDLGEDDDEGDQDEERPQSSRKKKSSKVKTTKVVERESDEDEDDDNPEDDEDADLSDRVIRRNEVSEFRQMQIDLAERDWKRERSAYIASGVPPFMLDLAEPVLSSPHKTTIDLSDGESLDFSDTLRQMLDGVRNVVDLTGEIGSSIELSATEEQRDEADTLLDVWDKQYS